MRMTPGHPAGIMGAMSIIRFPAGARSAPSSAAPPVRREKPDRGYILPLSVEGVCYSPGGQGLIHDLNFRIEPHRRTAIVGYNGAGKSLTLRLCHGLIRPTAGRIRWEGPRGGDPQLVARAQAMVFQKPVLLRRSVRENLHYVLKSRGIRGRDMRARARRAMERCQLEHLASRPATALSGGERQKLALARAWLLKPSILFLDEPTAALDPAATLEVERIINELHVASTTIFFSTHDMAQARRLADDVLFIHHGRILEAAAAEDFFSAPKTPQAQAFLAGELAP